MSSQKLLDVHSPAALKLQLKNAQGLFAAGDHHPFSAGGKDFATELLRMSAT